MSASERSDRITFVVGAVLLAMYLAQGLIGLEWQALARLQQNEIYKVISGCVLAVFLLYQWLVVRRRAYEPVRALFWHKLVGSLSPAVVYLHASQLGYGYLLIISLGFVVSTGLGLLHRPVLRIHFRPVYTWWFILHVATSSTLLVLAGYHIVIALAYE